MMKSGITRRIDELGRIVIPKEIRKNLKIRDSDELDINIEGNTIILNKHELVEDHKIIKDFLYTINKYLKKNILFTSREKIINYSLSNNENIKNLELNNNVSNIIENRKTITNLDKKIGLFNKENLSYIISPIVINGDLYGSLILYSEEEITSLDKIIIEFGKMFLENYLE